MFKKIIWVFMLLIMTACTILFKDGVEIVLGELTPTAVSAEVSGTEEAEFVFTEVTVSTAEPIATEVPTLEPTLASSPTAALEVTVIPFNATYMVQPGSPVYLDNFAHLSEGCNWQGVAGQVFDISGEPVKNLIVKVSGEWNERDIAAVGVTGMVTGLPYGPGSYEIVLGDRAVDSSAPLFLQVFDETQQPLTEPILITTSADCKKNLLMINFVVR